MQFFRDRHREQRVSDVGRSGAPETIVLRERALRIEISRKIVLAFIKRHKIATGTAIASVAAIVVAQLALIGFASTAVFYPSSCLGSWNNVQNALGRPDLGQGSPGSSFNDLNSASFTTSTAQMFCGNFSGDEDISQLQTKTFQSANLVLSWYMQFPEAAAATPAAGEDGGGGGGSANNADGNPDGGSPAASAPASTSSTGSTAIINLPFLGIGSTSSASGSLDAASGSITVIESTTTQAQSSTIAAASSTNIGTSTFAMASSTVVSTSSLDNASAPSGTPASADASTDATAGISSSSTAPAITIQPTSTPPVATSTSTGSTNGGTASTTTSGVTTGADTSNSASTPAPAPSPAPTPTPTPSDDDSSASGTTSWLMNWLPIAFADETSSMTNASSVMIASSALPMASSSLNTSSTQIPAPANPAPININTSMFQNIILPSSTANDFLAIVYSTDGTTWQPLTDINQDNWQQGSYSIPITSWDQLSHLQVAFVGLGAANAPKIYLDAAAVSVDYVDTPEATTDITPQDQDQQDQDQADSSTIPDVPPPPPAPVDAFQKTPTVLTDVFDQGARQQCVVAPFSQRVSPGENTDLSLQLFSDLTTPSSTPKKGVPTSTLPDGYQHAMYQTSVGSLPVGVSAYIASGGASSDTSSTQTIHVNVNSAASPGSYSLLVIYRERQDDASMRSTGCQFNLIVQ